MLTYNRPTEGKLKALGLVLIIVYIFTFWNCCFAIELDAYDIVIREFIKENKHAADLLNFGLDRECSKTIPKSIIIRALQGDLSAKWLLHERIMQYRFSILPRVPKPYPVPDD